MFQVGNTGYDTGNLLSYWTDTGLAEACSSTFDLYSSGVGKSFNFAELMTDMIRVQGLHDSKIKRVTYKNGSDRDEMLPHLSYDIIRDMFRIDDLTLPIDASSAIQCGEELVSTHQLGYLLEEVTDPLTLAADLVAIITPWLDIPGVPPYCNPAGDLDEGGFLEPTPFMYVKNYSNMEKRRFHLDNDTDIMEEEFTFAWEGAPTILKLVDDEGLPGQGTYSGAWGNTDPPSIFTELFILEYDDDLYDPSYGTSIAETPEEWERNTFQGYGLGIIDLPLTIQTSVPMNQSIQYLHWIDSIEENNEVDVTID